VRLMAAKGEGRLREHSHHSSSFEFASCMAALSWTLPSHLVPWWVVGRATTRAGRSRHTRPWLLSHTLFTSPLLSDEPPSMQALRRQPYPQAALDTSLFEEDEEGHNTQLESSHHVVERLDSLLQRLLLAKQFNDADRVRDELRNMGLRVAPRLIVTRAIRHALKQPPSSENALANFMHWAELLPEAHRHNSAEQLKHQLQQPMMFFRGSLLHPPPPGQYADLTYLTAFLHVALRKGFVAHTVPSALAFVVKYGRPSACKPLLDELIAAYEALAVTFSPQRASNVQPHIEKWYSACIKDMFTHKRIHDGMDLLRELHARGQSLSKETWLVILQRILEAGPEHNVALEQATRFATSQGGFSTAEMADLVSTGHARQQTWATFQSQIGQGTIRPLVSQLHALYAAGDMVGIKEMHIAAVTHDSLLARSRYVLAMMLFHADRKEHVQVLRVFYRYFYLRAVPAQTVREYVDAWEKNPHAVLNSDSTDQKQHVVHGKPILPKKFLHHRPTNPMEPSRHHTALVWRSLVELSFADRPRVRMMYEDLLGRVRAEQRAWEIATSSSSAPLPSSGSGPADYSGIGSASASTSSSERSTNHPQTAAALAAASVSPYHRRHFDQAHFTPFLRWTAMTSPPWVALGVVREMRSCGVEPNTHGLGVLLNAYARRGQSANVMRLVEGMKGQAEREGRWVDRLERAAGEKERMAVERNDERGLKEARRMRKEAEALRAEWRRRGSVEPTEGLYRGAMTGYVSVGLHEEALELFKVMKGEKEIEEWQKEHRDADGVDELEMVGMAEARVSCSGWTP
jgi:hypothetical protein